MVRQAHHEQKLEPRRTGDGARIAQERSVQPVSRLPPLLQSDTADRTRIKKATRRSLFCHRAKTELLQVEHECVAHGLRQRVDRGFVAWVVHAYCEAHAVFQRGFHFFRELETKRVHR